MKSEFKTYIQNQNENQSKNSNETYSLTGISAHIKNRPWISHKNDKAVKVTIKTQILQWKTIERNRRLRVTVMVRVRFLILFWTRSHCPVMSHAPDGPDLDGKNMRRHCQINTLQNSYLDLCWPNEPHWSHIRLKGTSAIKNEIKNKFKIRLKFTVNLMKKWIWIWIWLKKWFAS